MESDETGFEFSKNFDRLKYVGGWRIESQNSIKAKLYKIFQISSIIFLLVAITLQLIDFWLVFGDLEKMVYNFSALVLVTMATIKIFLSIFQSDVLNEFRLNLWRDYNKFNDYNDKLIKKDAVKQFKLLLIIFYGEGIGCFTFILTFAYFSYKWGPRELPFPAFVPFSKNDTLLYNIAFTAQALLACIILLGVVETDMILVGFLIQIIAQYKILNQKVLKINEIYDPKNTNKNMREVNFVLTTRRLEEKLKEILSHQTDLGK